MKYRIWLRAMRAGFLSASLLPVLAANALAWHEGRFQPLFYLLALVGIAAMHCGANLSNDYFDSRSGNDALNWVRSPYSGGSRVIVDRLLPGRCVLAAAGLFFMLSGAVGLYCFLARGATVLCFGLSGLLLAFFYTAPPLKLAYRGLGELTVGVCFGPLLTMGAYYLQARRINWRAFLLALPFGLMTAAILYINEFPDHEADRLSDKQSIVVLLGPSKAVWGYDLLWMTTYLSILAATATGLLPLPALVSLAGLPPALRAACGLHGHYGDPAALVHSQAATIAAHTLTGLGLTMAWIVARLM